MKTLKKTLFLIFTLTMLMGMTAMAANSPSKSTFKPTLKKTSTVYNGKTQKATIVVKDGKKTLKEGVDYKVSYENFQVYKTKRLYIFYGSNLLLLMENSVATAG